MLVFLLDFLKGALPVFISQYWSGLPGWQMMAVSLAPVLGHAYSPWLAFRGGKSVTTTFGVWAGLTLGTGPILMGMLLVVYYLVTSTSGWAVALMFLSFGGFVIWYYHDPLLTSFWTANLILLLWKHRHELASRPQIRIWVTALLDSYK
jgi:glycerol-3-phosphate acyltransferase PlsY